MPFREEVVNVKLAELLSQYGLKANPEMIIQHHKLPDVSIIVEGLKIILEGKFGLEKSLLKQAKERIEEGLCEISISVNYDKKLRNCEEITELIKTLKNYDYTGKIYYQEHSAISEIQFNNESINGLVNLINRVFSLVVDTNVLSQNVEEVKNDVEELVILANDENLWFSNVQLLEELKLFLAIEDVDLNENPKYKKDILRIAFFVLFDALIFHENIAKSHQMFIKTLLKPTEPLNIFLIEQWKLILKIDYKPIYVLAEKIILAFPTGSPTTTQILKKLIDLTLKVVSSGILRKHDFMGRIYHKLLLKTTGSFYATYYTAVPSAYLLTNLLYNTKNDNWDFTSLESLNNFRIIDPACGSGTLLSASYVALRNIYSSVINYKQLNKFHEILLENDIYGWDVLDYATHLTLTVLALHNPKILIKKSNIATLPNGIDTNGNVYLGSINILKKELELIGSTWSKGTIQSMNDEKLTFDILDINYNSFDVVIMNPPFSRSAGNVNTKFGYKNDEIKKLMGKELDTIIKNEKLTGIGHAGLGAIFIVLGIRLLKNNGRIGIVIPRGLLSGVSWKKIREILFNNCEIKYIISNHDVGNKDKEVEGWNWSEDTDLGEVMIIAEKTEKKLEDKSVTYVTLFNKPENEIESMIFSHQIINKKLKGSLENGTFEEINKKDKAVGTFYKIKQEILGVDKWLIPCLFSNPILNKLALKIDDFNNDGVILKDIIKSYIIKKRKILLAGMDRKQVLDLFEETDVNTGYHGIFGFSKEINKINISDNLKYLRLKSDNSEKYFKLYGSNLLIAERFYADNSRVISMYSDKKIITSMFWEIILIDKYKQYEKLISLWLNSTFGLIIYMAYSINNRGSLFNMKKENLINFKFPKNLFSLKGYDDLYNQVEQMEFAKMKDEFSNAFNNNGARKIIDDYFNISLDLKYNLTDYYKMLNNEPLFNGIRL